MANEARYTTVLDMKVKYDELKGLNKDLETVEGHLKNITNKDSDAFKKLSTEADRLRTDIGKLNTELKTPTQRLKEIKNALAAGGLGADEIKKLTAEAAKLKDTIGDVNKEIGFLAAGPLEKTMNGIAGTTEVVVGGFAALEGIMVLTGGASEDYQKILVRLTAAQSVLSGIMAVRNNLEKEGAAYIFLTTTAQKVYNQALQASTLSQKTFNLALGASVLGIGILAAEFLPQLLEMFSKEAKEIDGLKVLQDRYNATLADTTQEMIKERAAVEVNLAIARDKTKSDKTRNQALQDAIKLQPEYLSGLTLENLETEKGVSIVNSYTQAFEKLIKAKAAEAELIEIEKQLLNIERTRLDPKKVEEQAKARAKELSDAGELAGANEVYNQQLQGAQIAISEGQKLENDLLKQKKFLLGQINVQEGENLVSKAAATKEENKVLKEQTEIIEGVIRKNKNLLGQPFGPDSGKLFNLKAEKDLSKQMDELMMSHLASLENFTIEKERQRARDLKNEQDALNARQQMYALSGQLFSELVNLVGVKGGEMTDLQKALALVQITIAGAEATSNALRASFVGVPDPFIGLARFAAVSVAIIKTINDAKRVVNSGKGTTGAPSASGGGLSSPNTSQFKPQTVAVPVTPIIVTVPERNITSVQTRVKERNANTAVV